MSEGEFCTCESGRRAVECCTAGTSKSNPEGTNEILSYLKQAVDKIDILTDQYKDLERRLASQGEEIKRLKSGDEGSVSTPPQKKISSR